MGMKSMYDLRDMLCKELDEITRKGELGAGDLDIVHKLTDTIKNIDKIEMLEDDGYSQRRYSQAGDWEADMRGTYGKGSSYARRGTHYVRGHYSRDGARFYFTAFQCRKLSQSARHRKDGTGFWDSHRSSRSSRCPLRWQSPPR